MLCTCDLYNEGIDLPFVDTLLLLRPTSSATTFLQQLGRGLRLHPEKTSCLVLDFIGQHRAEFRFDAVYTALANISRAQLPEAIAAGFPFLPSGCVLELDAVARERVLDAVKRSLPSAERLAREVRGSAPDRARPSLAEFLRISGRDVEDVYRGDSGWTTLLARAGLVTDVAESTADLSRRLGWLLHVDEPSRLRTWMDAVERADVANDSEFYRRRLTMLEFQLQHRGLIREPVETARYLAADPAIRSEFAGAGRGSRGSHRSGG